MKKIITVCGMLLLFSGLVAQTAPIKQRSVGLSLGWQKFSFLDKHASPLPYSTNSLFPKLGLSYSRVTAGSRFDIALSASSGHINPAKFGVRNYSTIISGTDSFKYALNSPFISVDFKADYFRSLRSLSNNNFSYFLGGAVEESGYYGDAVAAMPWVVNTLDLSPALEVDYRPFSKASIGIKFDFAVIGLVTRATYSLFAKSNKDKNVESYFKQGSKLVSVDKFRKANMQVLWRYQASTHFAVGMSYRMKWMEISYPQRMRAIDKNVDLHFIYTY